MATSRNPALQDPAPPNTFTWRDRIRWADSDPMGIVFYGAYVRLIGVTESEMFRALGLSIDVVRLQREVWLPRKALHLEFHSAAQLEEEVLVKAWFGHVGSSSVTMRFEFHRADDDAHRASGSLTVVHVDRETMTPRPIPADVRGALARFAAA